MEISSVTNVLLEILILIKKDMLFVIPMVLLINVQTDLEWIHQPKNEVMFPMHVLNVKIILLVKNVLMTILNVKYVWVTCCQIKENVSLNVVL